MTLPTGIDITAAIDRAREARIAVAVAKDRLAAAELEAARTRSLCVSELQAAGRDLEILEALIGDQELARCRP